MAATSRRITALSQKEFAMTPQHLRMQRTGIGLIATGALFAVAALPPLHPLVRVFLNIAYWPLHDVPAFSGRPGPRLPSPLLAV